MSWAHIHTQLCPSVRPFLFVYALRFIQLVFLLWQPVPVTIGNTAILVVIIITKRIELNPSFLCLLSFLYARGEGIQNDNGTGQITTKTITLSFSSPPPPGNYQRTPPPPRKHANYLITLTLFPVFVLMFVFPPKSQLVCFRKVAKICPGKRSISVAL